MWSEANCFLAGAAWGALGVVTVVRWRPGGTGGPPSLRAGWWACRAYHSLSAGAARQIRNDAILRSRAWPEEPE